jgi:hypothetical protein
MARAGRVQRLDVHSSGDCRLPRTLKQSVGLGCSQHAVRAARTLRCFCLRSRHWADAVLQSGCWERAAPVPT